MDSSLTVHGSLLVMTRCNKRLAQITSTFNAESTSNKKKKPYVEASENSMLHADIVAMICSRTRKNLVLNSYGIRNRNPITSKSAML